MDQVSANLSKQDPGHPVMPSPTEARWRGARQQWGWRGSALNRHVTPSRASPVN